ncbi:MAG: M20/M25/M40 family metallo-hydrolase [Planctomycetes bacterium]|nr:M20/M25/M40 family metallo-hydrolase [Planctomycetota bacterium]
MRIIALPLITCTLAALALAHTDDATLEGSPSIAQRYRESAERILQAALAGNDAYVKLQELCDGIGHRLSGSPQLDQAIQWAADTLKADGQENVHIEEVMVPRWVRGAESLVMIEPREAPLAMLGLGGSVGTPPQGITAEVVVVRDEEEFEALGAGARGKIVLFNNPMPPYDPEQGAGYGTTVRFRTNGARIASEQGAVACLVRSVTAHSLRSPHTGAMRYGDAKVKIPAAAISTEDADMIARLRARGVPVIVTLKMQARTLEPVQSGNVIAELRGSTHPEEIVVIGGHIDSWDVGQGANDDGAGCVMAMEAINVLRRLNMIPRRTIRVVLWTNEENGLAGARQYAKDHAQELANHVAAIEADSGGFRPIGYSVDCADDERLQIAAEQMRDLTSLFESIGATSVTTGHSGADLGPMKEAGVVLMGHRMDGSKYFDYHHSHADTLDKVDPEELSQDVAVLATVAYILADMPERLGQGATR